MDFLAPGSIGFWIAIVVVVALVGVLIVMRNKRDED
jgi:hypothetical protein